MIRQKDLKKRAFEFSLLLLICGNSLNSFLPSYNPHLYLSYFILE